MFQFAVLMWLLTYVGALFNGLTLLILGEVILVHSVSLSVWLYLKQTSKHCTILALFDFVRKIHFRGSYYI